MSDTDCMYVMSKYVNGLGPVTRVFQADGTEIHRLIRIQQTLTEGELNTMTLTIAVSDVIRVTEPPQRKDVVYER